MDPLARTLRFDLDKVSQEQVVQFLSEHSARMTKVILYKEFGDKTGKPHLQGWALFVNEASAETFRTNVLRRWKKQNSLTGSEASCAVVKKDSYFVYTSKDKNCVYSVGVTDEERVANEALSYPKSKQPHMSMVDKLVAMYENMQRCPTKKECAIEICKQYLLEKKVMYPSTVKAQALTLWARTRGGTLESAAERAARDICGMDFFSE